MLKNAWIRRLALVLSLVMLLTSTANTTVAFIVTKTDSIVNLFVPKVGIVNAVLLGKSVEHPFGENYVIPDHIEFDFEVDLGVEYAGTELETTDGAVTADASGKLVVTVSPGETLMIEGIRAGTKVTVTELLKTGSGFTPVDNVVGKAETVSEDGSLEITFVNVYSPAPVQPATVIVECRKILDYREWLPGDTFTYRLEQQFEDGDWEILSRRNIVYDGEAEEASVFSLSRTQSDEEVEVEHFNSVNFTDIIQTVTFENVGTYHFRMTEEIGHLESEVYDRTVNTFTIHITDLDMDGKLEVHDVTGTNNTEVTKTDDVYHVIIIFRDATSPVIPDPENLTVNITVNKTVATQGGIAASPAGFEFILEDLQTGQKRVLQTDKEGLAIFPQLFTPQDVGQSFAYRLWEVDKKAENVVYDTTVYDIRIDIALNEDNQLVPTIWMNGEVTENCVAAFRNTYTGVVNPPTADSMRLGFWFAMMLISAGAVAFLLVLERKYRKESK